MKYWFKPWTHWHEITAEQWSTLFYAGYDDTWFQVSEEQPK
jgi:hypothetical protein